MTDAAFFWRIIRTAAAFRGKTMADVARDLGVSQQHLRAYEARGKFLNSRRLIDLSKSLDVSVETLMTPEALDQIEDVLNDRRPRMTPRQLYLAQEPL
ncbi:helix-turn-helix domain-containing protein [Albimonas pacifica]|uniref:Helix-turn-helix n=1 Tax=Albimonas pacifica TaxID=1114924 RepID=A0A1I3FUW6_9RHOB|nr:helix-turn-helix transcriptional regulator [Albimonas pacifica]SFI15043.1 Helix-turn-helix [Albimonas pacifica]